MATARNSALVNNFLRLILFALLSVMIVRCNNSESDAVPDKKNTKETSDDLKTSSFTVHQNETSIIDLQPRIDAYKSAYVEITVKPSFGEVSFLSENKLQYKANATITQATDYFKLAFYNNSQTLLAEDSLQMIISVDTTLCLLFTNDDYVYNVHGPVEIDVLANDGLCRHAVSDVVVEIATVQDPNYAGPQPPYFGTVQVLNTRKILYTPGKDFDGSDKFFYRMYLKSQKADSASYRYAEIHFGPRDCANTMVLTDDAYTFNAGTVQPGQTILLPIHDNDSFCTEGANSGGAPVFENYPKGGVNFDSNFNVNYIVPAFKPGDVDTFMYQLCVDDKCKSAVVTIRFQ